MEKKVEFIGERTLIEDSPNQEHVITVRIGRPEHLSASEYICAFQLDGLGESSLQYAHGIDAFQALIMALDGIRATIEKSGRNFTWQGGEKKGHGFPRCVPAFYGLNFSKHIDQLLDREINRFAKETEKKKK